LVEGLKGWKGWEGLGRAERTPIYYHDHVVVHIDRERALGWSLEEVLQRWTRLFCGPLLITRYLCEARARMSAAEIHQVQEMGEEYRSRLHDLSGLLRILNEHIARQANAEDRVKGRFWEGRFKSQALFAAMAYVDLNPVRAGIAETPEASDYTSIQERLAEVPSKAQSPQPDIQTPDGE
jgi:hypothetical protein